jgi:hypothetical protein
MGDGVNGVGDLRQYEYLVGVAEKIRTHGWAVQGVFGDGAEDTFSYTVGLAARGLPELWIGGMSPQQAAAILNDLASVAVDEGSFADGASLRGRADWSMPMRIRGPVSPAAAEVGVARALQPKVDVGVQQVLWPDAEGVYPDEDGYNTLGFPQPVLPKGRSYLLGLPVLVTVYEDGVVQYDVDTAETGQAIRESEPDTNWTEAEVRDDDLLRADADRADAAHMESLLRPDALVSGS